MNNFMNYFNETMSKYWQFSDETQKILQDIYQKNHMTLELPIDVKFVARELGFKIEKSIVNSIVNSNGIHSNSFLSNKTLFMDSNLSYKEQQFLVAKAIIVDLFFTSSLYSFSNSFLIHNNIDSFIADIGAILILLPIPILKKELSEYITLYQDSFNGNKFIEYLSIRTQVPLFQISFGYHVLTQMICYKRQKEFMDAKYDVTKVPNDEFEDIFN